MLLLVCLVYIPTVLSTGNLALNRPTTMTSISRVVADASSGNAVDGDNRTNIFAGRCSLTDDNGNYASVWWRVRLTGLSTIKSIHIVSRPLYEGRLAGVSVYVSSGPLADDQFFVHPYVFYDRGPNLPNSNVLINLQEPVIGDYVTVYNNRTRRPLPAAYSNSAILELCEVEVLGCPRGWYGSSCQLSCPVNCNEGTCDPETGRCYRGCKSGYTGDLCNENCPMGYHGADCRTRCGACGLGMPCDPRNGQCPNGCRSGYRTPYCNQTCPWGYFGVSCSQRCKRCPQNRTCDVMDGKCPGSRLSGMGGADPKNQTTIAVTGILIPLFLVIFVALGCLGWRNRNNASRVTEYISEKTQSGSQYLRKKSRKSLTRMTKLIRRGHFARNVSEEITPPAMENTRGKENVYINVGIDKVPIITFEEGGASEETAPSSEVPERPKLPAKVKASYENTLIHEIAINELAYVVAENSKDNNRQLKDQFKQLKYGQHARCDIAKKAENHSKNRFKSLYAYDHSRVKLKKDESGKSDYINANYIDGVEEPGQYIACQGPKINTMTDHWLMIWEEGVCIVVALANVYENGKEKCHQYWPDGDKNAHAGKFVIRQQNRKDYSFYCVRYWSVLNRKTKEERTVVQFHFREWPDHGAPEALSLLTFQAHIRKEKSRMVGRVLVHCSAGVGRTGTFLALDSLFESGRKTGKVNVFEYVKQMRTCRMNMVQTEGQYVFVHEALFEAFRYKKHALSYREFSKEFKKLSGGDQPMNETPLRLEYNEVESLKPSYPESRYKAALKPINKTRNREDEAMPVDDYRVILTTPVVGRNDYVNAVFISTHTEANALIITCSPLSHNVGDIWRLVHDHNVDAIVLMGSSGLPEFSHWLPSTEETVEFDPFFVRRAISFAGHEEIVESTAKFHVQESQEVEEVKIFEFLNWNLNDTYPTSPKMMVKMIEHVHDWRKTRNTDGPIVVVSVDGVSWCGVFCAGYNATEQITFDDEVDIFNIVRHLRVRRPELIPSFEEYQYCYRVVQNFLCSGGPYENIELPFEG
ncbi:receptor-type tyrosine-protein phosphatase T-like isoform X2 [Ostrea edulis]|uniref:receptor-type tyrosine-protein phosphatase T-like isoform X2 n=1 Tax=Ostrea edulis TaxID=37623 RepID=UPI0024AF3F8A|nr:receptor-type tyrosine-protein phosphatase T-like isoform X2 [Ostrea edulis]